MVRTYEKRSNNQSVDHNTLMEAIKEARKGVRSLRSIALEYGINPSTFSYHMKKYDLNELECDLYDGEDLKIENIQQVLSATLEKELASYLLKPADAYIGIGPIEIRQLAYQLAIANNIKIPASWSVKMIAGPDWFRSFMNRHKHLAIRVPEATSLARVSGFNKYAVDEFFSNYVKVVEHHHFRLSDIYNMDETGLNTVHKPNKIVAQRGKKQIGAVTSSERGEQVTLAGTVSAAGIALPPFFIFPRVRFQKDTMLTNAPTNSAGVAYKTGWMTQELFLQYLEHFVTYSRCSKEKPVLLLLDNHSSHTSLAAIRYAKDNGIVLLSFPPHCSHKLQPLDRSVYGPLKAAMNRVQSEWMISNPGKTMRITHMSGFVNKVYNKVFTEKNIQSGFKVAGIHPLNSSIFDESEFAPNKTVRPQDSSDTANVPENNSASTSKLHNNLILPADLRPAISVSPVKKDRRNSRRGKTTILTDTPEMLVIEEKELNKQNNLKRKSDAAITRALKKMKLEKNSKSNVLKDVNVIKKQKIEKLLDKPGTTVVEQDSNNKKQSLKRKSNEENKQALKKVKTKEDGGNSISNNINIVEKDFKDQNCKEKKNVFVKSNKENRDGAQKIVKTDKIKDSGNLSKVAVQRSLKTEQARTVTPKNKSKIIENISIEKKEEAIRPTFDGNIKRERKSNPKFSDFILD